MKAPLPPRLCFIDIETTGLDPRTDTVLEVGLVFVREGAVVDRRQWLFRARAPVAPLITALTGLTGAEGTSDSLASAADEIRAAIAGWTLVAHNAAFEQSFLGELISDAPMIDSWEVAQLLFPELSAYSLDSLVRWLEIGRAARHRALHDAEDTFLAVRGLLERFVASGRHASFLDDLDPARQGALLELLRTGLTARAAHPRVLSAAAGASENAGGWVHQLGATLAAPVPMLFEIEHPHVLEGVWRFAEQQGSSAVAVTSRTFRQESQARPALARHPVCRTELERKIGALPPGFARAWVRSWLDVTATGDAEALTHSLRERVPEVVELLEQSTSCSCTDARCPAWRARSQRPATVLISHELACDWLERGDPTRLFVLDADRLPDAERRRLEQVLWLDALERFPLDVAELRDALAALPQGSVLVTTRTSAAWFRVRRAAESVAAALSALPVSRTRARLLSALSDALEPPGPGFETIISAEAIARVPVRPEQRVARRLRRGHCLISSNPGGLGWTRRRAWSVPVEGVRTVVEFVEAATPIEALGPLLARLRPQLVVTREALDVVTGQLAQAGLSASLDEQRPSAVQLRKWRRDETLPAAGLCVVYGVRELRRAVLASQAERTVLVSAEGIAPALAERALRGLDARPLVLPATC
ncbi:MAG: 3'-5' exonuclease [Myxococcaceae bacterium]